MRGGSIRKYGRRGAIKKVKIDFTAFPSLSSDILKGLEYVFLVDLTSFRGKSCNRLLHQMLFGKVLLENQEKVKVYVIMKSKFSPQCKECGIGEKGSTLFIKDRFIHSGDGRVILALTPSEGSLDYRKQLSKYIYEHNQNLVILSEDKEYGYKIIGSSFPDDDPESIDYLKYFDMSHLFDKDTSNNSNNNDNIDESSEDQLKEVLLEKVYERVDKWIEKRLENNDKINLPKTVGSLEKTLEVFCKSSLAFPFKKIFHILRECGDIQICDTCQTCKPVSTSTTNQFYFSYLTLNDETAKQCLWMMHHIITEYTKNTINQVPIKLTNLIKSTSAPTRSIKHSPEKIISHLVNDSKLLKIQTPKPYISSFSLLSNQINDLSIQDDHTNSNNSSSTGLYKSKKSFSTNTTPLKSTPIKRFTSTSKSTSKSSSSTSSYYSNSNSNLFESSNTLVWVKKNDIIQIDFSLIN